jgi:hypothetical protein
MQENVRDQIAEVRYKFHKTSRIEKLCQIGQTLNFNVDPINFLQIDQASKNIRRKDTSIDIASALLPSAKRKKSQNLKTLPATAAGRNTNDFAGIFMTDVPRTAEILGETKQRASSIEPNWTARAKCQLNESYDEMSKQKQRFEKISRALEKRQVERQIKMDERSRKKELVMKEFNKRKKEIRNHTAETFQKKWEEGEAVRQRHNEEVRDLQWKSINDFRSQM